MADPRFDLVRTPACEATEELLPDVARAISRGEDPTPRFPRAARHLEECARCTAIVAELARRPEVDEVAEVPVEPDELFPKALAGFGLADPDPLARARAATRLAELWRVPPAALAALAERAAEDEDEDVRRAAIEALDALDGSVSLPQRVIDAWAESPEGAAPFVAGVLSRLAPDLPPGHPGVTELVAEAPLADRVPLTGPEGSTATLIEEQGRLWLRVRGLPGSFEKSHPVVALPGALDKAAPRVRWAGHLPGLVTSEAAVEGGSLSIPLGSPGRGALEVLRTFHRIYLLDPTRKRGPG